MAGFCYVLLLAATLQPASEPRCETLDAAVATGSVVRMNDIFSRATAGAVSCSQKHDAGSSLMFVNLAVRVVSRDLAATCVRCGYRIPKSSKRLCTVRGKIVEMVVPEQTFCIICIVAGFPTSFRSTAGVQL